MSVVYVLGGELFCHACGDLSTLCVGATMSHITTTNRPLHCTAGSACLEALALTDRTIGAWLGNSLTISGELQLYASALHDPGNALLRWYLHTAYEPLGRVLEGPMCLLPCALCGELLTLTRMTYLDETTHTQDDVLAYMQALFTAFPNWTARRIVMRVCTDIARRPGLFEPDPDGKAPRIGLVHKYVCEDCVAEIRAL